MTKTTDISKRISLWGAWLFSTGLLTGFWVAAASTGMVAVKVPHLALAAHLNALLGGLWLLALASTLPYLGYDEGRALRVALWIAVPSWANWLITLIASLFGVNGLRYSGDPANNVIAFLLQALVVFPSLVGAGLWIRGFYLSPQARKEDC